MINTLYLPEIREMLEEQNHQDLKEFCLALHPARIAEYMEGLTPDEAWVVLAHADPATRVQIFAYFDPDKQTEILETQDRGEVARLVGELASDDRVDLLARLSDPVREELLGRLPAEERRDIMRLSQYPEGTAGAMMTTEFAKLAETLTVKQAFEEMGRQAENLETIYYIYIVDHDNHLRGLVSVRQLVGAMRHSESKLSDLMETDLVAVRTMDDQEEVANTVARLDVLAIPVVDDEYHMVGIITHDDIIDVVHEEAVKDAHQAAGVAPLDDSYLKTSLLTLTWKRGIWLSILFFCGLLTVAALSYYTEKLEKYAWLIPFIPLVISAGGNSGNQSATLIITALSRGHITVRDWRRVVLREFAMGILLGISLSLIAWGVAFFTAPGFQAALVIPLTLTLVVICGTLTGSILPLIFERLGLDPAIMSNPFVAGIVDILGILLYMGVAFTILPATP